MRIASILVLSVLLAGSLAHPARAVLIASGDGTGNTQPPSPDFGFANVGDLNGLSGIYIGNGWVLTAAHVGAGSIRLEGTDYAQAQGDVVQLQTQGEPADLVLFRIVRDPGLPALPVAGAAPSVGEPLRMAGNGRNRGAATRWKGIEGWEYGSGRTLRWGTNEIEQVGREDAFGGRVTRTFTTDFTQPPSTADEAQAAPGDSGGGTFVLRDGDWVLAGVQLAILVFDGQPSGTALFGNVTLHADLSFYAQSLLDVASVPACDDGVDNDGDGFADADDPGCASSEDAFETDASLVCDDGLDNDGDGLADFGSDPGCASPVSSTEAPACDDGVDNDGDGLVDAAEDPGCGSPSDGSEESSGGSCGLLGIEPLLLAAALRRGRRRRSRAPAG